MSRNIEQGTSCIMRHASCARERPYQLPGIVDLSKSPLRLVYKTSMRHLCSHPLLPPVLWSPAIAHDMSRINLLLPLPALPVFTFHRTHMAGTNTAGGFNAPALWPLCLSAGTHHYARQECHIVQTIRQVNVGSTACEQLLLDLLCFFSYISQAAVGKARVCSDLHSSRSDLKNNLV